MQYKLKGIVVKESEKGESGKLLTILTGQLGVIYVNAYGVRKIASANLRSAQLFAYSELLLSERNGFYTLQESALLEDFFALREDIKSFAVGSYLCELATNVSVGGDEGDEILRMLLNALYATMRSLAPVEIIKASFEFRLAAVIGYEPDLSGCAACGKTPEEIQDLLFDLDDGCLLCSSCAEEGGDSGARRMYISHTCLAAMRHVLGVPVNRIYLFRMNPNPLREFCRLSEDYVLMRMEKTLKTLNFLRKNM